MIPGALEGTEEPFEWLELASPPLSSAAWPGVASGEWAASFGRPRA